MPRSLSEIARFKRTSKRYNTLDGMNRLQRRLRVSRVADGATLQLSLQQPWWGCCTVLYGASADFRQPDGGGRAG